MDDADHTTIGSQTRETSFEQFLWDLSTRFIAVPDDAVDAEIRSAQRQLCQLFGLDRSALWQAIRDEPDNLAPTHVFDRFADEGVLNPADGTLAQASERSFVLSGGSTFPADAKSGDRFPWVTAQLMSRRTTVVDDIDALTIERAQDAATFREIGVRSIVIVPLCSGARLLGCLTFVSLQRRREWPSDLVRRFTLAADVFAKALMRKETSRVGREQEVRLVLAAESADAGLWEVDLHSGAIRATEVARRLYGLADGEVATIERIVEQVHPDDRQVIHDRMAWAREHEEPYTQEYRLVCPDGGVKWVHSRGRSFSTIPGARPDRIFGATIDITEQKATEAQLQQALVETERLRDQLQHENVYLRSERRLSPGTVQIIGRSQPIRRVIGLVQQVAPTSSTVLLLGETGTGKGRVAEVVHQLSQRAARPMVRVNCAAIPPTLIESELFGREKGAYTGALTKQVGRFELAHGSTIFLDEIGDLPIDVQVKLLRVLDEKKIERLGSPHPVSVDVRIIAATNQDLDQAVRERRFRQDLFYRLNVFPILMPPLRDRAEDIPLLVRALVDELSVTMGRRIESIPRATMQALARHPWPGNIRELRNVLERAMITSTGPALDVAEAEPPAEVPSRGETLKDVERTHVLAVLQRTGWRIRGSHGAAAILGLPPTTLENRMKRLGIARPGSAT